MGILPSRLAALLDEPSARAARRAASGLSCHLVGGVLRDAGLGLERRDLDLVVDGDGHEFAQRLAHQLEARLVVLGGDRFAAYRLVASDSIIDIWGRGEESLAADLARRDFTINAMALGLESARLHDPSSGWSDLEARLLRAVGRDSFGADPLRVLRVVRLAATLPGFTVSETTLVLARREAERVAAVAGERVRTELGMALAAPRPDATLARLVDVDLLPRLWTGGEYRPDSSQPAIELVRACAGLEPRLARRAGRSLERPVWLHALMARTLSRTGGPDGAREILVGLQRRKYVSRAEARSALALATDASPTFDLAPRRFLAVHGTLWPEAVLLATARSPHREPPADWLAAISQLVAIEGRAALRPSPLLDGFEVRRLLALPPGPEIGRLLDLLLAAQLDGRVTSRAEARDFLERLAAGGESGSGR